jgi:hypothetical protein
MTKMLICVYCRKEGYIAWDKVGAEPVCSEECKSALIRTRAIEQKAKDKESNNDNSTSNQTPQIS